MPQEKSAKTKKSHARAKGQVNTSISLSNAALYLGRLIAKSECRTFSNFVARLIIDEKARRIKEWSMNAKDKAFVTAIIAGIKESSLT